MVQAKGGAMRVIHCPCGQIMRGTTHEEVARLAQEHAREVHTMNLPMEEALSMARPELA
jgi:hypothetical protein